MIPPKNLYTITNSALLRIAERHGGNKMEGTVQWYNVRKGYGFIKGDDGEDYFGHYTQIPEGTRLREEDRVSFESAETERGKQAKDIKLSSSPAPAAAEAPAESSEEPEAAPEEAPAEEPAAEPEATPEEAPAEEPAAEPEAAPEAAPEEAPAAEPAKCEKCGGVAGPDHTCPETEAPAEEAAAEPEASTE